MVGRRGWDATTQAILFVVDRHLPIGCAGFEKCPSPSLTPQWVIGKAVSVILDQDEPHFRSRGPMGISCRQLSVRFQIA